jgi:hypothetical protein
MAKVSLIVGAFHCKHSGHITDERVTAHNSLGGLVVQARRDGPTIFLKTSISVVVRLSERIRASEETIFAVSGLGT